MFFTMFKTAVVNNTGISSDKWMSHISLRIKEFWTTVAPIFYKMITQIKENWRFPQTWTYPDKPDKDHTLLFSYCPILLIDVDLKIICKAPYQKIRKNNSFIIHLHQKILQRLDIPPLTHFLVDLIDYSTINNNPNHLFRCRKSIWSGQLENFICNFKQIRVWVILHQLDKNTI